MPGPVRVEDFEVFRVFRAALLKFAQAAEQSVGGADTQIARTHSWLEGEQASYWHGQLRKRLELASRARDAVRQKKLFTDSTGHAPSAIEEEKYLARCLAAVAEAEQKIEAVRRWIPRLEKEAEVYRSGVTKLMGTVTVEVPQAVALLDRLAARLEEYVQIETPGMSLAPGTEAAVLGESMTRGGDAVAEPPAKVEAPAKKEERHVADGQ